MFAFSGPVSQRVIEGIGETLKQKMELEDAGMTTVQRVFSVFVEQMQNVVNYSAHQLTPPDNVDGELRVGTLIVGSEAGHFYVLCGNLIQREKMDAIREQLEQLHSLNREELKALYRERRKAADLPGRKGAGLGFIDMARKASRPMEHAFSDVDDTHVFFSIKAVIEGEPSA